MNHLVASAFKTMIEDLPFVDTIAGLVRTIEMKQSGDGQAFVLKRYPAACEVTQSDCVGGAFRDLMPDGTKKSVIYFEDNGWDFVKKDARFIHLRSNITLVCWINTARFKDAGCSLSGYAVVAILDRLNGRFAMQPYISDAVVDSISQAPSGSNIFSRYTYDESISQYLFWPYQAFALNIRTLIRVNPVACLDDLELETDPCLI